MRYVGYAWAVLKGLAALAVAIAMLSPAHTPFETIVVGALIVIYASIVGLFQVLGRSLLHISRKQLEFFITTGTLLKHPNLEIYSEALKEEGEDIERAMPKFYINATFNWLIGLIGTLALVLTALK